LFAINARVNQCKPWELCKTDPARLPETLAPIFQSLGVALKLLEPIFVKTPIARSLLPDASSLSQLHTKISAASVIDVDAFMRFNPSAALFPRINQ
jgi:methionyl-tRNA synthetase